MFLNRPNHDSGPYSHFLAPAADISGGAEEFVFVPGFGLPEIVVRGPGKFAGALEVTELPNVVFRPIAAPTSMIPTAHGDVPEDFIFQPVNAIAQPE